MEFDLQEQQMFTISELFALESDHMPTQNCLSSFEFDTTEFLVSVRSEAISLISQVQFSCSLEPFVAYLAINYWDRFMSKSNYFPTFSRQPNTPICPLGLHLKQGKPWFLRLIVISCLSLALKMKNTPFSLSDLQIEGCIFEAQSIQKMEVLILGALQWRMRSITPFSFLHFFVSLAEPELKDLSLKRALKERASEIIFNAHYDIKFSGFKPSIVAASALISASHELFPLQYSTLRASITACEYLEEETLCKCFNLMEDMERMEANESTFDTSITSTETPMSVLERNNNKRRRICLSL